MSAHLLTSTVTHIPRPSHTCLPCAHILYTHALCEYTSHSGACLSCTPLTPHTFPGTPVLTRTPPPDICSHPQAQTYPLKPPTCSPPPHRATQDSDTLLFTALTPHAPVHTERPSHTFLHTRIILCTHSHVCMPPGRTHAYVCVNACTWHAQMRVCTLPHALFHSCVRTLIHTPALLTHTHSVPKP